MNFRTWASFERLLCALFLLDRGILLARTFGHYVGYDSEAHQLIVDSWPLSHRFDYFYYAYHPPLGFWLPANIKAVLHLTAGQSIQLVAATASIAAFLFVRATLSRLQLLDRIGPILFLYLSSSIPLQIYLAHSINNDALVLAEASAVLYFSIDLCRRLSLPHGSSADASPAEDKQPMRFSVGLSAALVCAMLTKGSGLLLFALPVIACWWLLDRAMIKRALIAVFTSVLIALVVVSPYYILRPLVWHQSVHPFPELDEKVLAASIKRDEDRGKFISTMFANDAEMSKDLQLTDEKNMHMIDTWRDFWVKSFILKRWHHEQNDFWLPLESSYYYCASCLIPLGLIVFLVTVAKGKDTWRRFGLIVVSLSLLEIVALCAYVYRYPHPQYYLQKAIYIAPATWCAAYLISCLVPDLKFSLRRMLICLLILFPFMAVNHFVPIY